MDTLVAARVAPSAKDVLRQRVYQLLTHSLRAAAKEQGLADMMERLRRVRPELTD